MGTSVKVWGAVGAGHVETVGGLALVGFDDVNNSPCLDGVHAGARLRVSHSAIPFEWGRACP